MPEPVGRVFMDGHPVVRRQQPLEPNSAPGAPKKNDREEGPRTRSVAALVRAPEHKAAAERLPQLLRWLRRGRRWRRWQRGRQLLRRDTSINCHERPPASGSHLA